LQPGEFFLSQHRYPASALCYMSAAARCEHE
jgi:hypothetical protein